MKPEEIFNALLKNIKECEHRHFVKKEDGTYREETDEEFKKRLIEKYRRIEEVNENNIFR